MLLRSTRRPRAVLGILMYRDVHCGSCALRTTTTPLLATHGRSILRADGTVMGFDVGARRIGVAIGSAFSGQGRPLAVVDVHDDVIDWAAVDRLHKEWRPDGFVVGDPMTLDGSDQPIRKRAQAFARALRERYRKPVVMVDERSSSIEAAGRFAQQRAEGRSRRKDAVALDAVAAAIIVERWLAAPQDATELQDNTSP